LENAILIKTDKEEVGLVPKRHIKNHDVADINKAVKINDYVYAKVYIY
jgi:predicted RNA-binding protein with RPS1 domain